MIGYCSSRARSVTYQPDSPQRDLASPAEVPDAASAERAASVPAAGAQSPASAEPGVSEATRRLLEELHTHQAELEAQNEQLRRTQLELEATQAKYVDLYDRAPAGYLSLSEPGLIVEANDTATALLGAVRHELGGVPLSRFIESAEQETYYRHRKRVLETGLAQSCELRLRRQDGTLFWAQLTATAVRAEEGARVCRVVLLDVSARKAAEQALSENEAQLLVALEVSRAGMWTWDMQTDEVRFDARFCAMLGYAQGELPNGAREWATYHHPADLPGLLVRAEAHLRGETSTYESEHRLRDKSGAWRWIFTRGKLTAARPDGSTKTLTGIAVDVTERKLAEVEREELRAQLVQAQKMEAVGLLAGGIAHDFNNLLQIIVGHTEQALEELPPDAPLKGDLAEVSRAAGRAAELTRQLLAFGRRQVMQPVVLDLNALVAATLRMLTRVLGEDLALRFEPSADLSPVRVDKGQLEQVLMNLCVNARDAMKQGGTLTLATMNLTGDAARGDDRLAGPCVQLTVTDTGSGMDEATRARIFEPFFTTKALGQGSGLGLSMVYGIVRQHGGTIEVSSAPGEGTRFELRLPIAEGASPELASSIPPRVVGGTETVLVAEDETAVLQVVVHVLKRAGYTVLTARDGEEALRVFEEHADAIDLALLDVVMPRFGGREVMERMRARSARVRFVFSSGYSGGGLHTDFVRQEGLSLIAKPHSHGELLRAVRDALDAPRTP